MESRALKQLGGSVESAPKQWGWVWTRHPHPISAFFIAVPDIQGCISNFLNPSQPRMATIAQTINNNSNASLRNKKRDQVFQPNPHNFL